MWAPDAYEGAPTSVTAFMSVAVKAAGFALFFRICLVAFGDIRDLYVGILALISMLTMTWGNVAAVTQTNIKRLLAYSSISHAGYILMGLVAGTAFGVRAAAIYLLIYTVANLGVWAVVIVLRREDIKGEDMDSLKGLFSQYPAVAILMLFFLLSLAGIPPMGGFIAKYFVFASVMDVGLNSSGNLAFLMFSVAIVGALNAVVALYYYLRIVVLMFFERDFVPVPLALSTGTTITLVVAGLLTLIMGIYPQPFIELAESAALPLM
jgi:NADH-quinone oxidoreductase subunit N